MRRGGASVVVELRRPAGGPAGFVAVDVRAATGLEATLAEGVSGPDGALLHPPDGAAFVRALPTAFRGSRFWAGPTRQVGDA